MKLPPRFGFDIYVSKTNHVCIQQERPGEQEASLIVLHPEEVAPLIKALELRRSEAMNGLQEFEP